MGDDEMEMDDLTIMVNASSGDLAICLQDEKVNELLDEGFVLLDSQQLGNETLRKALEMLSHLFVDQRSLVSYIAKHAFVDEYDLVDEILEESGEYEDLEEPVYVYIFSSGVPE